MEHNLKPRQNYPTLGIHSTDNTFGFGYRKSNNRESDELFVKKFDNDLCNNLIVELNNFIFEGIEYIQNLIMVARLVLF